MDWFTAAVISAVGLSAQALVFQRLQRHYAINTFMAYAWLGATLTLGLLFLRPAEMDAISRNILPLALSGLTSMMGNYAYNRAIRLQGNIGYIEAVMSWRLIVTFAYSLLLLGAPFEALRLGGIVLIVSGVLAVSGAWKMRGKDVSLAWLSWALVGGLSFALVSIFVRFANDDGVSGEVSLIIVLLVAGLGFLGAAIAEGSSLRISLRHSPLVFAVIVCATLGNAALFVAYAKAPNLAYAIAIDNSRIIILYLVGLAMFSASWGRAQAVGIALTFVGILLLA
ncbi:MAG: DMT family transporter [Chloroflexi bacterium]|nr:DMT family transporter [Chloroflexota bacterium]